MLTFQVLEPQNETFIYFEVIISSRKFDEEGLPMRHLIGFGSSLRHINIRRLHFDEYWPGDCKKMLIRALVCSQLRMSFVYV